jgi:hypothetical protein
MLWGFVLGILPVGVKFLCSYLGRDLGKLKIVS